MANGKYQFKSDFARNHFDQGKGEGKAEGKGEMILKILCVRGIHVTDEARGRIMECTDLDRLDAWTDRAFTTPDIDRIFV